MSTEIAIGVSGGVAAFKVAALVSKLVQAGHGVTTIMTDAACEFVGPATFAALSGRPVVRHLFDPAFPLGAHIEIAENRQLLCIAPATADVLAKLAHGAADDLLATMYLCFTGPVLVAPAMNNEMWAKASVQRNVAQLREDGVEIIPPGEGWLSCRQQGAGRMAEPEVIQAAIQAKLQG
ncbi:MAG: flavoprotein [Planctomycetota bacterium]